jgi:hypothetical protein
LCDAHADASDGLLVAGGAPASGVKSNVVLLAILSATIPTAVCVAVITLVILKRRRLRALCTAAEAADKAALPGSAEASGKESDAAASERKDGGSELEPPVRPGLLLRQLRTLQPRCPNNPRASQQPAGFAQGSPSLAASAHALVPQGGLFGCLSLPLRRAKFVNPLFAGPPGGAAPELMLTGVLGPAERLRSLTAAASGSAAAQQPSSPPALLSGPTTGWTLTDNALALAELPLEGPLSAAADSAGPSEALAACFAAAGQRFGEQRGSEGGEAPAALVDAAGGADGLAGPAWQASSAAPESQETQVLEMQRLERLLQREIGDRHLEVRCARGQAQSLSCLAACSEGAALGRSTQRRHAGLLNAAALRSRCPCDRAQTQGARPRG